MKQFNNLIFAGTFDRLHIGHKKLLDMAFESAEKVSIGIATEKLYRSKPLANLILTYEVRKRAVEQYLRERNWLKRTRFFRLGDIYGPAIADRTMDSILVTELTKANAEKINKIRLKKGLPILDIIVAPLVMGEDGEVVTSERIRLGEMDREGHNNFPALPAGRQFPISNSQNPTSSRLAGLCGARKQLILPKYLRRELRKPLGKVISGSEDRLFEAASKTVQSINRLYIKPPLVISVGDIVTGSLLMIGFEPQVKIIDFRSRRKNIDEISNIKYQILKSHIKYQKYKEINKPGTINLQATNAIQRAIKKFLAKKQKSWIVVKGEEDLLALPAILLVPLHSIVLYGQIDMGVVLVEVTEEKKKEIEEILKKFE